MSSNRIEYVDAVKGFAILLMVMAHTIGWNFSDWTFLTYDVTEVTKGELNAGIIWKLIYSFHMPLFFLISGYFRHGINNKIQAVLGYIGKRSLEIYIFHLFFVIQLPEVGEFWTEKNLPTCLVAQIVYSFFISLIAIVLSCYVAAFLKKIKFCQNFYLEYNNGINSSLQNVVVQHQFY